MRDWINLFEDPAGELYHGTNVEGMVGIIASDGLHEDGWEGDAAGASFTTSKAVAKKFATEKSSFRAGRSPDYDEDNMVLLDQLESFIDPQSGCGGAIMYFNRSVLEQTHDLQNYQFGSVNEYEIRTMFDDSDLSPPVNAAITRIEFLNPPAARKFFELLPDKIKGYSKYKAAYDKVITLVKSRSNI